MRRLTRSFGVLVAVLGTMFVARQVVSEWDEVQEAASVATAGPLILAVFLGSLANLIVALGWRRCLKTLGQRRPILATLRSHYVGQLGKYLPGGIWSVVGRGEMARRDGVPGGVAYASTVMSLGFNTLAAILMAAVAIFTGAAGAENVPWLPIVALLPLGMLTLHPRVVEALLRAVSRLTRRDIEIPIPSWGVSSLLLIWHLPAWLAVGGTTWIIASAIDPVHPEFRNVFFAAVISWIVGFLVIPAPGGLGVREAVFVATATSLSSSGIAAAVALTVRLVFILVDLLGAAVTSLATQLGRRAQSALSHHKRR